MVGIYKAGFSLLESVIYIACSMLLGLLMGVLITRFYMHTNYAVKQAKLITDLMIAHDRIGVDIRSASVYTDTWKKLSKHSFICSVGSQDCCWYERNSLLMRRFGRYDVFISKWKKSSSSVIVEPVNHMTCEYHIIDTFLSAVTYCIIHKQTASCAHVIVAPRVGVCL